MLTADDVRQAARTAVQAGTAAVGFEAVVAALGVRVRRAAERGQRACLLFGTQHDAPDQVDAFRRLVGPAGLTAIAATAVELLQSPGQWPGQDESGDDELVTRYVAGDDAGALAELAASQRLRNYTAWKYGYVERVLDLVVQARASRGRLIPCDMPSRLQRELRESIGPESDVLRDLHCALTLESEVGAQTGPIAALWGDAHLEPARLPRFLGPGVALSRVLMVGGRLGSFGLDVDLGLTVGEPMLVPIGAEVDGDARFVLLLAAGRLAARVDRVREPLAAGSPGPVVEVTGVDGDLVVQGQDVVLDGHLRRLPSAAGSTPFYLRVPGLAVAGAVEVDARGGAAIDLGADGMLRLATRRAETDPARPPAP